MDKFIADRNIRIKKRISEHLALIRSLDKQDDKIPSSVVVDEPVVNVPDEITLFPERTDIWWNIESVWLGDHLLLKKAPKISQQDRVFVWLRKTEENKVGGIPVKKIFQIPVEKTEEMLDFLVQYHDDGGNPDQEDPDLIFNHQEYGIVHDPESPDFWKNVFIEERDTELVFEVNGKCDDDGKEDGCDDDGKEDGCDDGGKEVDCNDGGKEDGCDDGGKEVDCNDDVGKEDGSGDADTILLGCGNFKVRVFRDKQNEYKCVLWQFNPTKKEKPLTITLEYSVFEKFLEKLQWYSEDFFNGFEDSYILKGFTGE